MAVQRSARYPGNLFIVDNLHAIQNNSHHSSNQCNVVCLPFSRFSWWLRLGRQKPVNAAHVMAWRFIERVRFHLHLVPSTQINSAVCVLSAIELHVQFEIFKLSVISQLRPISRSHERTLFHFPDLRRLWIERLPPCQIFPVKQLNRLSPLWLFAAF